MHSETQQQVTQYPCMDSLIVEFTVLRPATYRSCDTWFITFKGHHLYDIYIFVRSRVAHALCCAQHLCKFGADVRAKTQPSRKQSRSELTRDSQWEKRFFTSYMVVAQKCDAVLKTDELRSECPRT